MRIARRHEWGLALINVVVTTTEDPKTKKKTETRTETQYGTVRNGAGVDPVGFLGLTDAQARSLEETGSCELEA